MKNHTQHRDHDHAIETELFNLRNVAYVLTHDLIRCHEDKFFGWIRRES